MSDKEKRVSLAQDEHGLDKPLCIDNADVQSVEYTDHHIDGVTYRVWSAFEGKTDAKESLSELMLRRLESGEEVREVADENEEAIEQTDNQSQSMM